jgi:hypothetical protein
MQDEEHWKLTAVCRVWRVDLRLESVPALLELVCGPLAPMLVDEVFPLDVIFRLKV